MDPLTMERQQRKKKVVIGSLSAFSFVFFLMLGRANCWLDETVSPRWPRNSHFYCWPLRHFQIVDDALFFGLVFYYTAVRGEAYEITRTVFFECLFFENN